MKKKFPYTIILFSLLSCNDDDTVNHVTDPSLNECYKIEKRHIQGEASDVAADITQRPDGSFVFNSGSPNQLICLGEDAELQWKATSSFISPSAAVISQSIQNDQGEVLVVAYKFDEYSTVAKFAADGKLIWTKKYVEDGYVEYNSIVPVIGGGGYWLAGSKIMDGDLKLPYITFIDEDGIKHISYSIAYDNSSFYRISKMGDGYVLVGSYDAGGPVPWGIYYLTMSTIGGDFSGIQIFDNVGFFNFTKTASTADKGVLLATNIAIDSANIGTNNEDTDILFTKIDASATIVWSNEFGGDKHDLPASVLEASDGGAFVLANTTSYGFGGYDILLIRTDANGEMLWQNTYGTDKRDYAGSLIELDNGDLFLVGSTGESPTLFTMVLDKNGKPK